MKKDEQEEALNVMVTMVDAMSKIAAAIKAGDDLKALNGFLSVAECAEGCASAILMAVKRDTGKPAKDICECPSCVMLRQEEAVRANETAKTSN